MLERSRPSTPTRCAMSRCAKSAPRRVARGHAGPPPLTGRHLRDLTERGPDDPGRSASWPRSRRRPPAFWLDRRVAWAGRSVPRPPSSRRAPSNLGLVPPNRPSTTGDRPGHLLAIVLPFAIDVRAANGRAAHARRIHAGLRGDHGRHRRRDAGLRGVVGLTRSSPARSPEPTAAAQLRGGRPRGRDAGSAHGRGRGGQHPDGGMVRGHAHAAAVARAIAQMAPRPASVGV